MSQFLFEHDHLSGFFAGIDGVFMRFDGKPRHGLDKHVFKYFGIQTIFHFQIIINRNNDNEMMALGYILCKMLWSREGGGE